MVKRLRMEGFIAMDYPEEEAAADKQLRDWVASGELKVIEDVIDVDGGDVD